MPEKDLNPIIQAPNFQKSEYKSHEIEKARTISTKMHNFPTWIFWMWQLNLIKGKVLGVTKLSRFLLKI